MVYALSDVDFFAKNHVMKTLGHLDMRQRCHKPLLSLHDGALYSVQTFTTGKWSIFMK